MAVSRKPRRVRPSGARVDELCGSLAQRLVPPMPGSAVWGWVGPLLVTLFGAFLRFDRLSVPKAVVFDETYYVGDAWAILNHGVEITHVKNADALLAEGKTNILAGTQAELVVHPPLGKEMIAVGEWLFGLTPFGWRFSVALIGSLSILLLARIVRRMTRSTLLGCVAGLLMALDGLELVLSRTAILDIFVMFWVLAAFGLVVIDRTAPVPGWPPRPPPATPGRTATTGSARSSACAGCWWPPGAAWARLPRASGTPCGTSPRSPGWSSSGSRRPPRRGLPGALARGAPQRRAVAAAVVRGAARRRLHRLVDRLVRHSLRLRPQRRRLQQRPSDVHDRGLAGVQPVDAPVRPRTPSTPDLPVESAGLADPGPADLVLLLLPARQGVWRARLHRAGGAGHRHAAAVVGRHRRDRVLPGVVDDAPDWPPARRCWGWLPGGCRGSGLRA